MLPYAEYLYASQITITKTWKEGDAVVELDQMKTEILTYETPLAEVRDSL